MGGHYHFDGEEYCADCLPVNENDAELDQGEQDTPANCSVCGKPLDYHLTFDGVDYVLNKILEMAEETTTERNRIMPEKGTAEETMKYYHGSRHVEIVRDWAEDLLNYSLGKERAMVQVFLALTAKDGGQ